MGKLKTISETKTVSDLLEEARSELESLKEEISDWRDKLDESDGLRETQKYSEVEECADQLEYSYDEIDSAVEHLLEKDNSGVTKTIPANLLDSTLTVSYSKPYGRFAFPRWARLGFVIAYLDKVREFLSETELYKTDEDFRSEVDGLDTSDLTGISFPGMY